MITVRGSSEQSATYLILGSQFCQVNIPDNPKKSNQFASPLDAMLESRGSFNENNVMHVKLEADIFISPELTGIESSPISTYPHRAKLGTNYANYGVSGQDVGHGTIADTQDLYLTVSSGDYFYVFKLNNVNRSTGRGAGATCSRYQITAWNENSATWHRVVSTKTSIFYCNPESYASCAAVAMGFAWSWTGSATGSTPYYTADSSVSEAEIQAAVEGAALQLIQTDDNLTLTDWGELAQEAVERLNFTSINMLEFISDVKNPTKLIPKLKNLRSLKEWAGGYLAIDFGILPTISDVESLIEAGRKSAKRTRANKFRFAYSGDEQTCQVGEVTCRKIQHLKLAVLADDKRLTDLGAKLDSIGMLPKLSNIWDLIPFSFAVDWLVNIGDLLSDWETKSLIEEFTAPYTVRSIKTVKEISIADEQGRFTGNVSLINYNRWLTLGCPTPPLSLQVQTLDQSHWLEAGALFVQRK